MEQQNILLKIQSMGNQFTKKERQLADYCLSHQDEIIYMSITDLALACGVGEASVTRFCRKLGAQGYQDFKVQVSISQARVRAILEAHADDRTGVEHRPEPEAAAGQPDWAQKVFLAHRKALHETMLLVDEKTLLSIVQMFEQADRIHFFGVSDSLLMAREAHSRFARVMPKVVCVEDPHLQAIAATMMTERDVMFIFSYSGASKDAVQVARLAHEAGAKVAAVTHYTKSPLTAYADAILLTGMREAPLERGSMAAKTAQLYLIDLLYQRFYERNREECQKNSERAIETVVRETY